MKAAGMRGKAERDLSRRAHRWRLRVQALQTIPIRLYHVAVGQPDFHRIRTEAATKLVETLLSAAEVVKGLV